MTLLEKLEYYYRKLNKFLNKPPEALKQNSKAFYYKRLKSEWRALRLIDLIIYLFVFANVEQLAYVFGKGQPKIGDYVKSIAFAICEALMAKAVSRAWMTKQKAGWLWVAMITIMTLMVPLNLVYDWAKSAEINGVATFTSSMVSRDWLANLLGSIGSGIISIMILGLSYIRMIQEKMFYETQTGFDFFVKDSERKRVARDAARERRAMEKKGKYVYKARVVGQTNKIN